MPGFSGPVATAGRPGVVYDTAINALGTIAVTTDGKEYIFLAGVASTVAGAWVTYDEDFATLALDTDVAASLVGQVAIASAAVVANKYGWYQIGGANAVALAISGGGAADNGKVFATSTAFTIDDVAVNGAQVHGAIIRTAEAAGVVEVQLNRPFIGVTDQII